MTAVVLAAAFAFLLTGCGGSSASTSFTWFVDNIPANLDPQVATKAEDVIACENLYGGLVRRNASGELVPDLCERWEISSDGLTYTFYLKSGLTYTGTKVPPRTTPSPLKISCMHFAGCSTPRQPRPMRWSFLPSRTVPPCWTALPTPARWACRPSEN